MDEIIKEHLDAIAEHLNGTKNSFLFLLEDESGMLHGSQNCMIEKSAVLVFNYIDGTPAVDTAFSNLVLSLQTPEQKKSFKERLAEKMEQREDLTINK